MDLVFFLAGFTSHPHPSAGAGNFKFTITFSTTHFSSLFIPSRKLSPEKIKPFSLNSKLETAKQSENECGGLSLDRGNTKFWLQ